MTQGMQHIRATPPDEIFRLNAEFSSDPRKKKINGGIGLYVDENGGPFVLPIVQKLAKELPVTNYNYLPISGDPVFLSRSLELILGSELFRRYETYFAKQGVMGGTNGLYIWGNFVRRLHRSPVILVGDPTWENHNLIFSSLGFSIIRYSHFNKQGTFDYRSCVDSMRKHPGAYLLFHGGLTHNPTGVNPTEEDWRKLVPILKKYHMNVCIDFAYPGLGESIVHDCYLIRLLATCGIPLAVILSYSKAMTLYQHRTGALFILSRNRQTKEIIESHLKQLFRSINSNPAAFGELIAKNILDHPEHKRVWIRELAGMAESIQKRRFFFITLTGGMYNHLASHRGLFSLLGLTRDEVQKLKKKYGIYLLSNSRINFGGVSLGNIPFLAKAVMDIRKG